MLNSVIKPAIKLLSDSSTKIKIIIIIGLGLVGFSSKWIKNPWKKKNQEVGSPSKKEGEQGVSPLIIKPVIKPVIKINFTGE